MTNAGTKGLRFAALVRVSTEKQRDRGRCLEDQHSAIAGCVGGMGGTVAKWYQGQEHSTPGFERKMFDRMLAEAQRDPRPFDAVIVQ